MAYHRISLLISAAKQAPAEYMGAGETHITDFDPESKGIGQARFKRRRKDGPTKEDVDSWVMLFNSGMSSLAISAKVGFPYLTVQNEIAKHPAKSRGAESTVPTAIYLTPELSSRVEDARGDEAISRFILRLLETGAKAYSARAAAVEPLKADVDRWLRMHNRGLDFAQIAEAVGVYPKIVSRALRARLKAEPRKKTEKGAPRKSVSLRMPVRLKNLLDYAAQVAGTNTTKIIQMILGRELDIAGI